MKRAFVAVYVLVLAAQLPHVWSAYASIEAAGWTLARATAFCAALAFELSIGVFTIRVIRGSKRWTRLGLAFFVLGSALANADYYEILPWLFGTAWPWFAAVALPTALALYAHEFGAEVVRDERRTARQAARLQESQPVTDSVTERDSAKSEPPPPLPSYRCESCGRVFRSQNALNSHSPRGCAEVRRRVAEVRERTSAGR